MMYLGIKLHGALPITLLLSSIYNRFYLFVNILFHLSRTTFIETKFTDVLIHCFMLI